MGGLVVKQVPTTERRNTNLTQALITAYNTARYSQIKKNIIGIVFFGTPHRAADYTTILRALLDFSFPTRKFVNDLLPVSQTIREINNAFADRAQEMQLASFWETAEMTWGGVNMPLQIYLIDYIDRCPGRFGYLGIPWRNSGST